MTLALWTAATIVAAVVLAVLTGTWRPALWPWRIKASLMTADRLGFAVRERQDIERVNQICAHFAAGFNDMILSPWGRRWAGRCESLPALYRPFYAEGAAMGYPLSQLLTPWRGDVESRLVRRDQRYKYLQYVGIGFWSAMRGHSPAALERRVGGLDPLYRFLCFDGYGFKLGFFDYGRDSGCLRRLEGFTGYARSVAFQGVGRSFWFRFLNDPASLIEHVGRLADHELDAAAGVGLAAAFVHTDDLERVFRFAGQAAPVHWRPHLALGMTFALKARDLAGPDALEEWLGGVGEPRRRAIRAAVEQCDRIERQVRYEKKADGYRAWRQRLTDWLATQIVFPFLSVRGSASRMDDLELVRT